MDVDDLALKTIRFETRKSSAASFAAGIPEGFALAGTVPVDVAQYYVHAFRVMQTLAYLYGWQEFLSDVEDEDDETVGRLAAFLGVMLGVAGASTTLTTFAANVAAPAVQKQVATCVREADEAHPDVARSTGTAIVEGVPGAARAGESAHEAIQRLKPLVRKSSADWGAVTSAAENPDG